jgi:2-oxoisovalerate dehydrogenase E1 component beta subunit
LKVVCPGSPQDAYDLLRQSVRDPNPVLYFEHKALYRSIRSEVVRRVPTERLGRCAVRRSGRDVTVVTYGGLVGRCLAAAERATSQGVDPEVIDLRTVHPFETEPILESVRRTGRLLIVHEDTRSGGIGAEITARICDGAFFDMDAPIRRLTAPDTPIPFAKPLEDAFVPSEDRIVEAITEIGRL